MATGVRRLHGVRTIRTRILLIAWVPSLALLLVGVAIAGYLGVQAKQAVDAGTTIRNGNAGARDFILAIENELPVSAAVIVDQDRSRAALDTQRARTDQAGRQFAKTAAAVNDAAPAEFQATNVLLRGAFGQLADVRARVDAGKISLVEAGHYYGGVIRLIGVAASDLGRSAPNGQSALEEATVGSLYEISAEMIQGNALAYAAFSDAGMNELQYQEFIRTAGVYRDRLQFLTRGLPADTRKQLSVLTDAPAWQQQSDVEQAVLRSTTTQSTRRATLPISRLKWEAAASEVSTGLTDVALTQTRYGSGLVTDAATRQLWQALIAGGLLIALAVGVLLLTARASNRLIDRLRDLRRQTLDLAQNRLPDMVTRLRAGEKVDAAAELPVLDLGVDEIGQVADAFNHAQRVAVTAAVQEAETRAGLRTVFLNIAYRSQVIVHRQLGVLERAERFQEDPDQLKLLFELDHLATRSRRNAENLVILGGGKPGRRWRNPVSLIQVVRGAISEAQDYTRVSTTPLPPGLAIRGAAVADVIHLLAEIVDNATAFSPPMSRVEVRGNLVGRGLVIEIEDQGLGIPADQLAEFNEMLQNPPDFHVMALSEEPRLGMFVIAQLARSQGIRVTLTPSPAYGGTKAVVLLPNEVIDTSEMVEQSLTSTAPSVPSGRRLSPVIDRPALTFAPEPSPEPSPEPRPEPSRASWSGPEPGSSPDESEGRSTEIRLGNRLGDGGGRPALVGDEPPASHGGWPAPAADLVAPQVPALAWVPTATPSAPYENEPAEPRTPPNGNPTDRPTPGTGTTGRTRPGITHSVSSPTSFSPPTTLPPGLPLGGNRPELPRRRRQAHLDERLRTPAGGIPKRGEDAVPDPELARNRMAAFQRGTRQARTQNPDDQA